MEGPSQLSNDNLISVLWNAVPFKLQKEAGEIKDWSLQELQRLLRAEARVEECERHTNQNIPGQRRVQADSDGDNPGNQASDGRVPPKAVKDKNRGTNARGNPELELRNVKCFGCHKRGHFVSECLDKKNSKSSRVIQAD